MKARILEQVTMETSKPVLLNKEEQGWSQSFDMESYANEINRQKWSSHVPGSNAIEHVIIGAIQDTENMGYDVTEAESFIDDGAKYLNQKDWASLAGQTAKVFNALNEAKKVKNHPYWQFACYDNFDQCLKKARFEKHPFEMSSSSYEKKTYLGWLGQICGAALGTAVEGYTTKNIRQAFGEISGYVRQPNTFNDDITYEIAFLLAFEEKGEQVTSKDIAHRWVSLIPMGWSAEEIALRNLQSGIFPPESGSLGNPYREWIGAQMRGAICGMVAPGDPQKAAQYAFTDGVISHHNNGVLGEVFNACLVSLSYVHSDVTALLRETIDCIPSDSEYRKVLNDAVEACQKNNNWETAWNEGIKEYGRYNWIHAYPNAVAEVIALFFGHGDYDETMHIIAMEGYDVDCNAAQIGTAVAIMNGQELNRKWTDPIGDDLETYMRDSHHLSIKGLSLRTVEAGRKAGR
jgi:ADP-ribosylglycohydrolase